MTGAEWSARAGHRPAVSRGGGEGRRLRQRSRPARRTGRAGPARVLTVDGDVTQAGDLERPGGRQRSVDSAASMFWCPAAENLGRRASLDESTPSRVRDLRRQSARSAPDRPAPFERHLNRRSVDRLCDDLARVDVASRGWGPSLPARPPWRRWRGRWPSSCRLAAFASTASPGARWPERVEPMSAVSPSRECGRSVRARPAK